jgi:hypothetical protein
MSGRNENGPNNVAIRNIGGMNDGVRRRTPCIDGDVPIFAP